MGRECPILICYPKEPSGLTKCRESDAISLEFGNSDSLHPGSELVLRPELSEECRESTPAEAPSRSIVDEPDSRQSPATIPPDKPDAARIDTGHFPRFLARQEAPRNFAPGSKVKR